MSPIVREGTILKIRCKKKEGQENIVLSVSFLCPCGTRNRRKAGELCGQNETKVQFWCGGCGGVVELRKNVQEETC